MKKLQKMIAVMVSFLMLFTMVVTVGAEELRMPEMELLGETSEISDVTEEPDISQMDLTQILEFLRGLGVELPEMSDVSEMSLTDIMALLQGLDVSGINWEDIFKLWVIYGDANSDQSVDMKDVLILRKHIANLEVSINLDAADVNLDDSVDMKDVLILRKYIAHLIDELPLVSEDPFVFTYYFPLTETYHRGDGTSFVAKEYKYDENNNQISVKTYSDDGVFAEWREMSYDEDNNMVGETEKDANGKLIARYEYFHDKDNPLGAKKYTASGEVDWTGCWDAEYDKNGNQTSLKYYLEDGTVAYWEKSSYTEDGLLKQYGACNPDGTWKKYTKYTYDENGNTLTARSYLGDESPYWQSSWDAEYDENGNNTKRTYYAEDGSVSQTEYCTYDEGWNELTYELRDASDGLMESAEYTYDEFGNQIKCVYYNADSSINWECSWDITYDEEGGRVMSRRTYLADGSVNWNDSNDYTYEENGSRQKEVSYEENGEVAFITESVYDDNFNLTDLKVYDKQGALVSWTEYTYFKVQISM